MSDFQRERDTNKQGIDQNLKIELYLYNEDSDCDGCSVCVEGNGISRKQIDFLRYNKKKLHSRVASFSLDGCDVLNDIEFKIIDKDKEFKKFKLEDIKCFEKDGVIEVCIDKDGSLHPKKKKILVNMHYVNVDLKGWDHLHVWLNNDKGTDIEFKECPNWRFGQFEMEVQYDDVMGYVIGKNNWTEKEIGDRFLNLRRHEKDGKVNVYVLTGKEEVFFEPPLLMNFHYHKYSGNFNAENNNFDGWDIWMWMQYKGKGCGKGFPVKFYKFDNYGALATYVCSNLDDIDKVGFLVRKSNGDKWEAIDMEKNRYIEAEQLKNMIANGNRVVDIYLAENDLTVGYSKDDIDLSERIVDAKFRYPEEGGEIKSVYVELNTWLDMKGINDDTQNGKGFKLVSETGYVVPIEDIQGTGEIRDDNKKARLFRINLQKSVEAIDKRYTVILNNSCESPVSIRTLYKHNEFKKKCIYEFGVKYIEKKWDDDCTQKSAEFKVLAPDADELELCLYDKAIGGEPQKCKFKSANYGMWYLKVNEDLRGKFYTYRAKSKDKVIESIDSYAKVTEENCRRGIIIDPQEDANKRYGIRPEFNNDIFPVADELGAKYTKESTEFRIWAPSVDGLELCLYDEDEGGKPETYPLSRSYGGTWYVKIDKDLDGKFYTYKSKLGTRVIESIDPCAKSAGVNGERGAIIDLKYTNPEGWDETPKPRFDRDLLPIINEINVRDYTIDKSSGVEEKYRGKYLGLTIEGTKTKDGISTCLDHIKEMGYTHIQIMPIADFGSVDESIENAPGSRWGYDTVHWFVPEGSYSTNAHNPKARIRELKKVIQTYHENGIKVILDVVFNHTYRTQFSPFNVFAPNYFYRIGKDGEYSKATGCSNEIASEKEMVRKYIVDAIKYWLKEFKVDGFRFDVMYLLDIDTMNAIRKAVDEIDPDAEMYGEGWTPPIEPKLISKETLATKNYADKMPGTGFFNSDLADAIKGDFDKEEPGYATQREEYKYKLMRCIEADKKIPDQVVNFVGVHDNLTWWDKICKSFKDVSEKFKLHIIRKCIYKLGYSIIFTRPGLTLVPEGDEFLRSKNGENNSYDSGDEINGINWNKKKKHPEIVEYIKGLIKMKKAYKVFSGKSNSRFLPGAQKGVVAYSLKLEKKEDKDKVVEKAVVVYNGGWEKGTIAIPKEFGEDWVVIVDSEKAGAEEISRVVADPAEKVVVKNNRVNVLAHSSTVLIDRKSLERYRKRKKLNAMSEKELGNTEICDSVTVDNEISAKISIPQENITQNEICISL